MSNQLLKTIEKMGTGLEQFTLDSSRKMGDLSERLDTLESSQKMGGLEDRIGRIESLGDRPQMGASGERTSEMKDLSDFIRTGRTESKSMTIGSDTDGGAMVPQLIADEIIARALSRGGLASIVRRTQSPTSDYVRLLNRRGQNASWISEAGTRTLTNNFELREIRPTNGEIYAAVSVSNWLINDSQFNVERMILDNAEEQFARSLETAVYNGDGSNKPTGLLANAPSTSDDTSSPERDADVIQQVAATSDLSDSLISLFFTLAPEYRRNSTWVMSSASLAVVRKLRDSNGSGYLWQAPLGGGVDASDGTLLGKPVITAEDLPTIGGSPLVNGVLVGDFVQGYELVQIGPLQIIRDQISTRGFTIFYIAARFGGRLIDNNSLKVLAA
jgi:HK97 family phage major capsid protein